MEIFLLRHAESVSNTQRLVCGAADYPLSINGKKQVRSICDKLKAIPFTYVYASPLARAYDTIGPLSSKHTIVTATELVELDTGEVSHWTVDHLWSQDIRYKYQGLHPDLKYPDGECLSDMISRVVTWYKQQIVYWKQEDIILIAGHEGTICAILHYLLKLDIKNYPTFTIRNAEGVRVSINQDHQMRISHFSLSAPMDK